MTPLGLLLALGLTFGLAAESCGIGVSGLTIDDMRDEITVTNASTTQDAHVFIMTSRGERDLRLAPGESETYLPLAARKYVLEVYAPPDPSGATYKQSLLDLRDKLETLSLHPENPSADAAGALAELATVQSALEQLHDSPASQSCTGVIKTGVPSHATLTWNESGVTGTGIWGLSCE